MSEAKKERKIDATVNLNSLKKEKDNLKVIRLFII